MSDAEIELLFNLHRHFLDEGDGGYVCDTAPDKVKAFIAAVVDEMQRSNLGTRQS